MQPVALITGGARGIGRAIASHFASDHNVAITWHSTRPDALLADHPDILAAQANLGSDAFAAPVVAQVIAHFGRLDVIVNNAGAIEMDDGDTALNHAVNVAAPMALLRAALGHLRSGSSVVNISSVNARFPALGAASYSASKGALDTWTRAMARELGPRGIRVNGVAPGAVERRESPRPAELIKAFTAMTSLGRVATPEDIAPVVHFLASPAAGWITGETIGVSGGYRL